MGEFLAKIAEAVGNFGKAYELYEENDPNKFVGLEEDKIFSNFHKLENKEERLNYQQKLFMQFLESIPNDIMNIDVRKAIEEFTVESRVIIEEYK